MNTDLIFTQLQKCEYRLEGWAKTQSIQLNAAESIKLQDIHQQLFGSSYKSSCRACVNEALTRLWKWYSAEKKAQDAALAEIAAEFEIGEGVEPEVIETIPATGVKKRGRKTKTKK